MALSNGSRAGMSRRELIRNAGIAGAAAWAAPVIVDSLASPAAAATGGPITCSWFFVIVRLPNGSVYYSGAEQSSGSTCTDLANSNVTACVTCNTVTYSMDGNDLTAGGCLSGTALTNLNDTVDCTQYVQVNGNSIQALNGATLLASFSHPNATPSCSCPSSTAANNTITVCNPSSGGGGCDCQGNGC